MHPPAWDYTSLLNNSWPTCWSWEVHQQHFFWVKTVRFFPHLQCPPLHSISDHQECHRSHLKINTTTQLLFSLGALSSIEPTDVGSMLPPCRFCLWKLCSACGKTFPSMWRMSCRVAHSRGWMTGIRALAGDTTALIMTVNIVHI